MKNGVKVTPWGGLEVDGKWLFSQPKVRKDIELLSKAIGDVWKGPHSPTIAVYPGGVLIDKHSITEDSDHQPIDRREAYYLLKGGKVYLAGD